MKNLLLFVFAIFVLTSCYERGKIINDEVVYANDDDAKYNNYDVRFLFEVDGIKVYSFYDGNHTVYFTNSTGNTSYDYSYLAGKVVHHECVQCLCNQSKGGEE